MNITNILTDSTKRALLVFLGPPLILISCILMFYLIFMVTGISSTILTNLVVGLICAYWFVCGFGVLIGNLYHEEMSAHLRGKERR